MKHMKTLKRAENDMHQPLPSPLPSAVVRPVKIEIPRTIIGGTLQHFLDAGFVVVQDQRGQLDEQNHCVVELPAGWATKAGPAHSYTTLLMDQHGRVRASMYHKMDYGNRCRDRRDMEVVRRFGIDCNAYIQGKPNTRAVVVLDAGRAIHTVGTCRVDRNGAQEQAKRFTLEQEAVGWLDQHYPGWREPSAHWLEVAAEAAHAVPA